ncbi:MAG: 30S ribosomal protein S4 [Candidatus ainarchaeum sp.]|nr:30S ribosomal protein S4 [Candidatus ainarchaeum sp.]
MGDPKKLKKQYARPRKSFQKERIDMEKAVVKEYGLKNKREYYIAESFIRRKRGIARSLLALALEERLKREKELIDSLKKVGILRGQPTLEDVLMLSPTTALERRLQTVVYRKGLANTQKQARQFVVHGHIGINGKKLNIPGYMVTTDDEASLKFYKKELLVEKKAHKKNNSEEKVNKVKEEFDELIEAEKEAEEASSTTEEKKE